MLPPLRAAVAAGEALLFEGDYLGNVVNLAARLVSVAEPGQVLVPADVGEPEASGLHLWPLGTRVFKGFSTAVPVAVVAAGPEVPAGSGAEDMS